MKHLTILALIILTFARSCGLCHAADITPGYTFISGEQNVTHTKLNLLGAGTVNPSFFSGKPSVSDPPDSYTLLLWNPSSDSFFRWNLAGLFSSQLLISNRVENVTPSTNAFLLTYTLASGLTEKVSLRNAVFEHQFLINGRDSTNTTNGAALALLYDNGGYFKTARTNLFHGWQRSFVGADSLTNAETMLTLTNQDALLVWDSARASNRVATFSNVFTGFPLSTNATNGDSMIAYIAATNSMAKIPMSGIKYFITNGVVPLYSLPTTSAIPSAGSQATFTHSLSVFGANVTPTRVRVTLLCNNAGGDAATGYALGDEVAIESCYQTSVLPLFGIYANATTIGVNRTTGTFFMKTKTTGAQATPSAESNFVLKVRAWYDF